MLAGMADNLTTTMASHGTAAQSFIPRAMRLARIGAHLAYDCARSDRLVDAAALAPFAEFGQAVALRNVSLEILRLGVTTSYNTGLRIALTEISAIDRTEFMPILAWAAQLAPITERAEVNAFLAWHSHQPRSNRYRREVTRALLTDSTAAPDANAPAHAVTLVSPAGPAHATRAGLARITADLSRAEPLVLPRRRFVVVLTPVATFDNGRRDLNLAQIPALDALSYAVHAASAIGRTGHLLTAYREAVLVWRLVHTRHYPAGRYDLLSVLADQMVHDDTTAHRLRRLVDSLGHAPALLDTVRHWLIVGPDRRKTAARLRVHPNTLDRRLRQIELLTGLSLTRYDDLHLLRLAIAATPVG